MEMTRFSRWTVGGSKKSQLCGVLALKRAGFNLTDVLPHACT